MRSVNHRYLEYSLRLPEEFRALEPTPVPEQSEAFALANVTIVEPGVAVPVEDGDVDNIEIDCAARVARMRNNEPRRFLLTMGGAGAQRELFKAVVDHCKGTRNWKQAQDQIRYLKK